MLQGQVRQAAVICVCIYIVHHQAHLGCGRAGNDSIVTCLESGPMYLHSCA